MRVDMQRVVHFGTGQRDDRDRSLARDLREFQIHVRSRVDFLCLTILPAILAPARLMIPSNYATRPRVPSGIRLPDLSLTWARSSNLNRSKQQRLAAPKRKS